MKTETSTHAPPETLVSDVRRLKQHFPYRICWGAFRPENPNDTLTGANYDKRRLNAALRKGYVAFSI